MPPRSPRPGDVVTRDELETLVEASQRARRRQRRHGAAALLVAAVAVASFAGFGGAGREGAASAALARARDTRSQAAGAQSLPVGALPGDSGGFVSAFAFDPRAPDTVYVATSGEGGDRGGLVYKSTDAGEHWRSTTPADWTRVDALATDPRHPDTLYAGTGIAVFKTVDGGRTWEGSSGGLFSGPSQIGPAPADRRRYGWVTALAVDPTDSGIVYAATPTGIRRSTDGGRSWSTVLRPGKYVAGAALVIAPTRPQVVYVAASVVGPAGCGVNAPVRCRVGNWLYGSGNAGKSWRRSRLPLEGGGSSIILAADSLRPARLYVAQTRHAFASADAGASWRSIVSGTPKRDISSVVVDPRRPGVAYLVEGLHGDVLKTTGGGRTWIHVGRVGSPALIALDPARPRTIYAAIDRDHRSRVLRSTDGGRTWATAG